MPVIPVYQDQQVSQEPLRPVAANAEAFGAGAARQQGAVASDLLQTGSALQQAYAKIKQRQDEDQVFRAQVAMQSDWMQQVQRYRQQKGNNANGIMDDATLWWAKAKDRYEAGLTNDQKVMLAQSAARVRLSGMSALGGYVNTELERSRTESWAAAKNVEIQLAAQTPTPEVIGGVRQALAQKNADEAARQGWSPEQLQAENLKDMTALHVGAIRSMVDAGKLDDAQAYLEANKPEISKGQQYYSVKALVDKGVIEKKSDDIANSLPTGDITGGLAKINAIQDTDLRSAARTKFRQRVSDAEMARNIGERNAADQVWAMVAQGKTPPPSAVMAMGGRNQIMLKNYMEARAQSSDPEGYAKVDDMAAYDYVQQQIEAGNFTKATDLTPFIPHLSRSTIGTLRSSMVKAGVVKPSDMKREYMERLGKTPGQMGNSDKQDFIAFQSWALDKTKESNRASDLPALADQWFTKGVGKGLPFFDGTTYGKALTAGDKTFKANVPESVRGDLTAARTIAEAQLKGTPAGKAFASSDASFYTQYYFDANRWLTANRVPTTPAGVAAIAILKANNKPLTPANVNAVITKMKASANAN